MPRFDSEGKPSLDDDELMCLWDEACGYYYQEVYFETPMEVLRAFVNLIEKETNYERH